MTGWRGALLGRSGGAGRLLTVTLLAAAVPAAAQNAPPPPPAGAQLPLVQQGSDLRHPGSGYRFPDEIQGFPLSGGRVYAVDNFSVRYGELTDDLSAPFFDIFIYPATVPVEVEAFGVERLLVGHANATPIADDPQTEVPGRYEGWFDGTLRGVTVVTGYFLAESRGWLVKVRATTPPDPDDIARLRAAVATIDADAITRPYKPRR